MMNIRPISPTWMDEIPRAEPDPKLEHVYTYMALQFGNPQVGWLLSPLKAREIVQVLEQFQLKLSTKELLLQYINWYEAQQARRSTRA